MRRRGPARALAALCAATAALVTARAGGEPATGSGGAPGDGGVAAEAPADPSAPTVGASLDRSEAHVGDQLTLTVTAVARAAIADTVRIGRPDLGPFEVLDVSEADKDLGDGRKSRRFVFQVTAYELGELVIPPITVEYAADRGGARRVRTAAIAVTMRKVVDAPQADLQPLARTRDVMVEDHRPTQALMGAGAAVAAALLGLAARALWRRRRRRGARPSIEPPAQIRPAHEVALARLATMRLRGRFDDDGHRPFHFELAEVVRSYLGDRFAFDSLELTTTELLGELERVRARRPSRPEIEAADVTRLRGFLDACDLVKFAKAPSSDPAAVALLDEAEAIVRATVPPAPATARAAHG